MRITTHEMARRLGRTVCFALESDHRGTFWRDERFCRNFLTGDDDEKTRPYASGLHRADGSCDNAFARANNQPTRFHSRTARRQTGCERLRNCSRREGLDRLDRWCPRTAAPIDRSRRSLARVRGGEESTRHGDRRRFEGASDQVSGHQNTGVAVKHQPSHGDRSVPTGLGSIEVMNCSFGRRQHGGRAAPLRCGLKPCSIGR
jgi:hypothetical protein